MKAVQKNHQHKLLDRAMRARMAGRYALLAKICQLLRKLETQDQVSDYVRAHLILLETFSVPFELNLTTRQQSLEQAVCLLQSHELRESFLFLYEQSGLFLHLRNYKYALEYALRAQEKSFDRNSRLSAYLNACIAKEALGMDVYREIGKLQQEIFSLPVKNRNPKLYKEFINFYLRACFRKGDFASISDLDGLYFSWLCLLPQIQLPSELKVKAVQSLQDHESYADFALNTLIFKTEDTELNTNVLPMWCDRLYLWTWTLLKNPSRAPLDLILDLLEKFPFEKQIHRMTFEDRLMVMHSLLLLSLIEGRVSPTLETLFQRMAPFDYEHHPFLRNERRYIEALRAMVRHGKTASQFTGISSFNDYVHYFSPGAFNKARLLDDWPGYRYLAWQNRRPSRARKKFSVTPHLGRFVCHESGTTVESLAVAQAFAFFLRNKDANALTLLEFNRHVFGFEGFDSFLHYRKIYNLVSRMKKMTPGDFDFKIREDVIHFQIQAQKFFLYESDPPLRGDVVRWRSVLSRIRRHLEVGSVSQVKRSDASAALPIFPLKDYYSRAELQNLFQWSKPMAVRKLKELCQKGLLTQEGRGRRTVYRLSGVIHESQLMSMDAQAPLVGYGKR